MLSEARIIENKPLGDFWWVLSIIVIIISGVVLRLIGIEWGLPLLPWGVPIHPDEAVSYIESMKLYSDAGPRAHAFLWGGCFYLRISFWAHEIINLFTSSEYENYLFTIFALRGLNVIFAVISAGLVAWTVLRIGGRVQALVAMSLFLVLPAHVLASHYARPDILLVLFLTATLACAIQTSISGSRKALFLGSVFCGLATATMLSGLIGLLPLAFAVTEWHLKQSDEPLSPINLKTYSLVLSLIVPGWIAGWLLGNYEALVYMQQFLGGIQIASDTHNTGTYSSPYKFLSTTALFGFGTIVTVAMYLGFIKLFKTRFPGYMTFASWLIVGVLLLGRVGGDMMRHMLFLTPAVAIISAVYLGSIARSAKSGGPMHVAGRLVALGSIIFTMQLSLVYVLSMQIEKDPRYAVGAWLNKHALPNSQVGVTANYKEDRSFGPRLTPGHSLKEVKLRLYGAHDLSNYLAMDLDYIVTSDYSVHHNQGGKARKFFQSLFNGEAYTLVHLEKRKILPVSIPLLLDLSPPSDYYYTNLIYYVFARTQ